MTRRLPICHADGSVTYQTPGEPICRGLSVPSAALGAMSPEDRKRVKNHVIRSRRARGNPKGAGAKPRPSGKRVSVTVRLSRDLYEWLQTLPRGTKTSTIEAALRAAQPES